MSPRPHRTRSPTVSARSSRLPLALAGTPAVCSTRRAGGRAGAAGAGALPGRGARARANAAAMPHATRVHVRAERGRARQGTARNRALIRGQASDGVGGGGGRTRPRLGPAAVRR